MTRRMEIDHRAVKVLAGLSNKVKRQIAECIDVLADDPLPPDARQIRNQVDVWRISPGSRRIA